MKNDDFGDRMKEYEKKETARHHYVGAPIYARIDGRSFSKFTRGMRKPFDQQMTYTMIETTKYLVEKTNARIGYTQSDEISLVWLAEGPREDIFFSGKIQKMVSVLASMATAKFNASIWPEEYSKRLPHFDARVIGLPNKTEAANMFLWRAMDARKNAISSVAQSCFSHKQLQGKNQNDMLAMLDEIGVYFDTFWDEYKYGSFVRRSTVKRHLTEEEIARIPSGRVPEGLVDRTTVERINVPPFNTVSNREEVIFDGAEPKVIGC